MYNSKIIRRLITTIHELDGCNDKDLLKNKVFDDFHLTAIRSVLTCEDFSIRFSKAESINFANVVISLSTLRKYDDHPFFVCVVTPYKNYLLLANSYMIDKASHSSLKLRIDNIKGSILGSNIIREKDGIKNNEANFERLFSLHEQSGSFEGNIERIVENTHAIVGTKESSLISEEERKKILDSVYRSQEFSESPEYEDVYEDLRSRVEDRIELIKLASKYNNINLRGRLIEYIITGDENDPVWRKTMNDLRNNRSLSHFTTKDDLGDYSKITKNFNVKADIKSEMMNLSSNPKGYNVDKMLNFLTDDNSVLCMFFVGVDTETNGYKVSVALCSVFDEVLLNNTRIQHHWAGRGTRGVAQFNGIGIKTILERGSSKIDTDKAISFLEDLIDLDD